MSGAEGTKFDAVASVHPGYVMFFPAALYSSILMCRFRFTHDSRVEESDGENLTVPFGFFPSNGESKDVVRIRFSLVAFKF